MPAVISGTRGAARDLEYWLPAFPLRSPLTHRILMRFYIFPSPKLFCSNHVYTLMFLRLTLSSVILLAVDLSLGLLTMHPKT